MPYSSREIFTVFFMIGTMIKFGKTEVNKVKSLPSWSLYEGGHNRQ